MKMYAASAERFRGIAEIQRQHQEIYDLNKIILLKLDEVGPEMPIGKNISRIRGMRVSYLMRMPSQMRQIRSVVIGCGYRCWS